LTFHVRGFGFLNLAGPDPVVPSAFVAPPDLRAFLAHDQVEATLLEEGDGRFRATDLRLVERRISRVFGRVVRSRGKLALEVDPMVSNTSWRLPEAAELKEGEWAIGRVRGERDVDLVRVVEPDEVSLTRILIRRGLRPRFPDAVRAATREASATPVVVAERRDLREVPTLTIDAPSSRDLDDALSALPAQADGALRVLVSIADVDALVPAEGVVDEEARRRGTSVYLPGHVIPMLPEELSTAALSLLPDQDRPALTVELRIDPEGEVVATDLYLSLIRSHARLSYEAVTEFLDRGQDGAVPDVARDTLRRLRAAAARLSAVRAARGGVKILREEAYLVLDADTREPTDLETREETSAHRLVERLMVAANEAVARWLVERGLPGVFRVHAEPDAERAAALTEFAGNLGFETAFGARLTPRGLAAFEAQYETSHDASAMRAVMSQALGPARYTTSPGMHFGLAAPLYLHFTSPIRRYADLAVHRVIKRHLRGDRSQEAGDDVLRALAEHVDDCNGRAAKSEREFTNVLVARLFSKRLGEACRGNVIMVKPFGLIVQLANLGVSGVLPAETLPGGPVQLDPRRQALVAKDGTAFTLGQRLEVEIVAAHEDTGRLELGLRQE
jgi:ribonuclease R